MSITFNGKEVDNPIAIILTCIFASLIVVACFGLIGAILLLIGVVIFFIGLATLAIIVFACLVSPFIWAHNKWRQWNERRRRHGSRIR